MSKNIVRFRSTPENYEKEKDGRKPNTVRILSQEDPRRKVLAAWHPLARLDVVIENTETAEIFVRDDVTDVTYFNHNWIISWRHPE